MRKREFVRKAGLVAEEILYNFLNAQFITEEQFRRRVKKPDQFDLVPPRKQPTGIYS